MYTRVCACIVYRFTRAYVFIRMYRTCMSNTYIQNSVRQRNVLLYTFIFGVVFVSIRYFNHRARTTCVRYAYDLFADAFVISASPRCCGVYITMLARLYRSMRIVDFSRAHIFVYYELTPYIIDVLYNLINNDPVCVYRLFGRWDWKLSCFEQPRNTLNEYVKLRLRSNIGLL